MEVQGGSKIGQLETLRCKVVSLEAPAEEVLKNGFPLITVLSPGEKPRPLNL